MNAEWTTRRCGEATLVELTLTTDRPRRVRIESTGDDPIEPPLTDGIPDAGWDEDGYTGVVDGRLGLGFATTEPPSDPPVHVEWRGPPDDDPTFDSHPDVPRVEATATGVLRALSDPRPPREAIPAGRDAHYLSETDDETASEAHESTERDEQRGVDERVNGPRPNEDEECPDRGECDERHGKHEGRHERAVLDRRRGLTGLAALERRVTLAERLDDAETLTAASEAIATAGGLDGVRALDRRVERDREELRALAARVETLWERVEAVEVPTGTLTRIGGEKQ